MEGIWGADMMMLNMKKYLYHFSNNNQIREWGTELGNDLAYFRKKISSKLILSLSLILLSYVNKSFKVGVVRS